MPSPKMKAGAPARSGSVKAAKKSLKTAQIITTMNFEDFENDIQAKAKSAHIRGWEPKDIAQEFRFAIWRNQDKFNPKLASARTFAVRIMQNKLIDLARRSKSYIGLC